MQADAAGADWSTWDIGGALRLLRSGSPVVVRQTLRSLHVRWWHCTAERMLSLLRAAGVPDEVLQKARQVCETCTVCRPWFRPTAKAIASVRISEHFNWAVQVDLLFVGDFVILHMICECLRWAQAKEIANRETSTVLSAIVDMWFRIWGPPKLLISDGEGALDSEEGGVFCERWGCQRKLKAPGQHAHMIERHHELLRQQVHRVGDQAQKEGLHLKFGDILAESVFAKNAMIQVHGWTPYQALLGRTPHMLADIEAIYGAVGTD